MTLPPASPQRAPAANVIDHPSHGNPSACGYAWPFQNPDLDPERRIDNALSLMTLEEKIDCLSTNPSVPRLGIRGTGHIEGLHGAALGGPANWAPKPPVPTTCFPQAIGLAMTWDPELVRRAAAVQAYEARYVFQNPQYAIGGLVVRAPNADLGRDVRWGRTEECFGEDAFLAGCMTVAFVRGLQGDNPRYWMTAALLKHFLANSNETLRERSSSDFDQRLFHEYYSVPFCMGIVEGKANCFMAAYNAYNSIPCTVHPVLKNVVIDRWGLDGIICTDGGALKLLVTAHRYYPDLAQAAAWCIKCGISQFLDQFRDAIKQAIERNLLSERQIEQAVRRNFRVMIRLGLWDPPDMVPYARIGTNAGSHNDAALGGRTEQPCPPWLSEAHKSLAKLVTLKSIVLLKNADAALPLDRTRIKSIAVIGRWADQVIPDWYGGGPAYRITPLQGIRAKVGADVTVAHASGEDAEQTARLARKSDVVIMVVGNHPTCDAGWAKTISPSMGKEAVDRQSLELDEQPLIRRVYEENRRTIVVLISSFPYAINWAQQHIPAIVHMTHASQETGSALADVLFGDYNPAGRLVQTWPGSLDDLPDLFDYDLRRGRTYMYFTGQPLYPFGHGLSYTTFVYSNLCVSEQTIDAQGQITVSADVTNSGQRSGEEVVQLYVKYLDSKVDRPIRQLVGFARLAIEPGRTVTARIPLRASQLAYWDATERGWRVEPGRVELMLGASSADIRLRRIIQVSGPQSNVNPGCFSRGGQSEG